MHHLECSGSTVSVWQFRRNGKDGAKAVGVWCRLNVLDGQYILSILPSCLLQT